eukprot:217854-Pyramimonas_sp.AAC.1
MQPDKAMSPQSAMALPSREAQHYGAVKRGSAARAGASSSDRFWCEMQRCSCGQLLSNGCHGQQNEPGKPGHLETRQLRIQEKVRKGEADRTAGRAMARRKTAGHSESSIAK